MPIKELRLMESAEPLPPDRKQLKVHEKTREPAMINKKKFIVRNNPNIFRSSDIKEQNNISTLSNDVQNADKSQKNSSNRG